MGWPQQPHGMIFGISVAGAGGQAFRFSGGELPQFAALHLEHPPIAGVQLLGGVEGNAGCLLLNLRFGGHGSIVTPELPYRLGSLERRAALSL